MQQDYQGYTPEDFEVWQLLFNRQRDNLNGKSCDLYLQCLDELHPVLANQHIPKFDELRSALRDATGWTIEVVPGLIPVEEFFQFLSEKKFCSSTWLRSKKQLDYLEEPDMFHDIFGHTPMIIDRDYADFMQRFGELGVQHGDDPQKVKGLQNLYWFSIEFGLIRVNGSRQTYGAGIASSYGETNHVFEDKVKVDDFDIDAILEHDFINSEIQNHYFELQSFEQLYAALDDVEAMWSK